MFRQGEARRFHDGRVLGVNVASGASSSSADVSSEYGVHRWGGDKRGSLH